MGWPGACYDIKAREADYAKVMSDAAEKLGVKLEVAAEPITDMAGIDKLLAECKQCPPDGIILTVGSIGPTDYWPLANKFAAAKGDLPTIIFSPMGTSFTGHQQATRTAKKCFVASTQHHEWLADGMRMLYAIWAMKNTRICLVNGDKTLDQRLDVIGTTLHHIPLDRWTDEAARLEVSAEVQALANELTRTAKKIVEPKPQDVLNAAKNYFIAKRIMAAEKCQRHLAELPGTGGQRGASPARRAWHGKSSTTRGASAACECDWNAAISMRLCNLLCQRPGFQQDPVPNTVNGTFMGAHCTSATKLHGYDKPALPMILRSHSESEIGVSPQVLFPVGEAVTVMKFDGPKRIILGTGQVAANIDTPPCGGCRTSVELKMDDVADPRDCKGFHQLFILGKHDRAFRAYCQLAGIEVVSI